MAAPMMKTSHFPQQCFRHCIAFHPQKLIKSRDNKAYYFISRHCSTKTQPAVRVRFAPSPTGYLHLGGLRTALYNFLFARSHNGTFILRIEDTDQSRAVPGAIEYLQNSLHWAGIDPDEGPVVGGKFGPYIQSERLKIYQENIQTLLKNGWAYRCFCTERRLELMRKEAARKGEPSRYDNRCRSLAHSEVEALLAQGTEHVIRLKLEPTPDPWDDMVKGETSHDIEDIEGDPVLMKSDGYPTYHFANVVDDHLMEVSHVLRGSEWLPSTPKHILLYKAFGWQPPKFGHMPLIVNQDGTKLSKRQGDIHVDYFRELGCFPQAVLNYITTVGGGFQKSTLDMTLQEMCSSFDVRNIRRNPGRLSPMWLQEANRLHIKSMVNSNDASVVDDLVGQVRQLVVSKFNDRLGEGALREQVLRKDYIVKIIRWSLLEDRTSYLTDFVGPDLEYLWVTPSPTNLTEVMLMEKNAITLLTDFMHWVSSVEDFSLDNLNTQLKLYLAKKQLKPKKYFALIRTALTGLKQGAPIAEMLHVIGHDNITHRLETVLESLKQLPSSSGQNV